MSFLIFNNKYKKSKKKACIYEKDFVTLQQKQELRVAQYKKV